MKQICGRMIDSGSSIIIVGLSSTLVWMFLCLVPPRLFHLINYKMYDVMHRGLPMPASPGGPVIVDIDEKSLTEIGQWPWPRYTVARLLKRIHEMEADAVGLDIVFAEPDRTSVHIMEQNLAREIRPGVHIVGVPDSYRNNDAIFAGILDSGPFVLGYPFFYAPKETPSAATPVLHPVHLMVRSTTGAEADSLAFPLAHDVTPNIELLGRAAGASGFINATPDEDGVLRRIGVITRYENRFYPGLALATYLRSAKTRTVVAEAAGAIPEYLVFFSRGRRTRMPLDKKGHLLLRYYSSRDFFRRISASDILTEQRPLPSFKGRMVFIGSSAPALADAHPTPLHPLVPGIDLHAILAQNILWDDFIRIPWWAVWGECGGSFLAGLFVILALRRMRPHTAFPLVAAAAAGIWFGARFLLCETGIFFSPQFPLMALISGFLLITLVTFVRKERRNRDKAKEILRAQELTLHGLAALAETRDNETGNHLMRTCEYVRILAEELVHAAFEHPDLTDKDAVDCLVKTAPLHDIGKVGIPDRILLKPGRLTRDEFKIMKKHPAYGKDALERAENRLGYRPASPYFRIAKEIVYTHHERWAGGGYPEGLKGEGIPLAGRLMALADVYDALRSKRVYKPAWSHEQTRRLIVHERGQQFDPRIVDAFLSREEEFIRISKQFADTAPKKRK